MLHGNTATNLIRNHFSIPLFSRYLLIPDGILYMTGGFMTILNSFVANTMSFDENHQMFIGKEPMSQPRGDHAMIYING